MTKEPKEQPQPRDSVISIIGPGMRVLGDCETEGTLRVEGTVQGKVNAGKAVVVGRDGTVKGDIFTQDAVIGGHVTGKIIAESRLELQETSVVDGEIHARRIKLEEGGRVNGTIHTGEVTKGHKDRAASPASPASTTPSPPNAIAEGSRADPPIQGGVRGTP